MSQLLDYLFKVMSGIERYLYANKAIIIMFAVLLGIAFFGGKSINRTQKLLFTYGTLMSGFLLFPFTAMAILIYQTAFYDYEWAWSLVPVTVICAYGILLFCEKGNCTSTKKKLVAFVFGIAGLLLITNQAKLLQVPKEEAFVRNNMEEVLIQLDTWKPEGKCVLWAPKVLMQESRRKNGTISLVYGKDMWDPKSGAYDYEVYSEALTDAYVWLEQLTEYGDFAETLEDPKGSMAFLVEQYEMETDMKDNLDAVLEAGANALVFPHLVAETLEETLQESVAECNVSINKFYTENYTIYLLQ